MSHPSHFTPGKETQYPLYRRLGGPQGQSGELQKISPPPGFDPQTVQPVGSCYTNCTIPAPSWYILEQICVFKLELMCYLPSICVYSFNKKPAQYREVAKGKTVLLKAWSGPEGSRKLRFPDFMTTAQDGGKVVSLMHWPPLPPGNTPGTHFC